MKKKNNAMATLKKVVVGIGVWILLYLSITILEKVGGIINFKIHPLVLFCGGWIIVAIIINLLEQKTHLLDE